MKKISTLFKKDPNNLGRVINEINPENKWVYASGIPTRKFDGTACCIIAGELYKRYDIKKNKKTGEFKNVPENSISCQSPDQITGHWPHWLKCNRNNPADKYHFEAFDKLKNKVDGTYELCGEKIQGNPENIVGHELIKHGQEILIDLEDFSFDSIKEYLSNPANNIEGIVFHNKKHIPAMCKIRKSDFGVKR